MLFHFKDSFPQLNDLWEQYLPYQKRIEATAKTVLLAEGKHTQHYIFIEKGCVRAFFTDNTGAEKTVQFFFENEGLISFDSFVNNTPSLFTIETIEPSVIYLLPKNHVLQLIDDLTQRPQYMSVLMQLSARRQIHYMNEFVSFIRDTPEQRYQRLLIEKPYIVQRVPQQYIASYLGISKVHLSRIKSKLKNGNAHF